MFRNRITIGIDITYSLAENIIFVPNIFICFSRVISSYIPDVKSWRHNKRNIIVEKTINMVAIPNAVLVLPNDASIC